MADSQAVPLDSRAQRGGTFVISAPTVGGPAAPFQGGWNRPHFDLTLPQRLFSPILRSSKNAKTRSISGFPSYSGGGIRTRDLRVMSPARWLGWALWSAF